MDTSDDILVEIRQSPSKESGDDNGEASGRVDKTSDESSNGSVAAPSSSSVSSSAVAAAKQIVPSLRGAMSKIGGKVVCKGKWAMSDADHANPMLTSDFEFHLVTPQSESGDDGDEDGERETFAPVNGLYQGWFHVKQASPLKPLRVEDKDMEITFMSQGEDGAFAVAGHGHNFYGKFNLRGTLSKSGEARIFREYYFFNPPPTPAQRRAVATESKRKVAADAVPSSSGAAGSRSARKVSLPRETEVAAPKTTAKLPPSLDATAQRPGERSHRLNPALRRCAELLKELSKMPQSVWFLEPVDPVKFNIPEYPKIIKQPMDFSTIKANLEKNAYEAPEDFAAHVRLVFRNAMAFNTDRDSLVHIAAKDIGAKFEDKFNALLSSLVPDAVSDIEPAPRSKSSASTSAKNRTPSTASKAPRESSSFFSSSSDRERRRSAPGPRPQTQTAFIPPAAVDPSTLVIMEMQRKMESMEAELGRLRATMQENAIKDRVEESVEAAKKPLTLDEKKALVTEIYKLPPEKMDRALDIIRESISSSADDAEIEIPIDSLDTLTLRRLQKFIQDHTEKKKRPGVAAKEPPAKKSKKGAAKSGGPAAQSNAMLTSDLALFDDTEPLLFENEQLDSSPPPAPAAGLGTFADSFHDEDDEDDDNKWGQDTEQML